MTALRTTTSCSNSPVCDNTRVEARYLDYYSHLDSPVHRVPANIKLAAAIVIVFFTLLIFFWEYYFFALIALGLLITTLAARLPLFGLLARIKWALLVILFLSAGQLFRERGLELFLRVGTRATLCLWTMSLLANTTRFTDLLQILGQLGVPHLLLTTIALMYRYLFVLSDEMNRMRRARLSRTFNMSRIQTWKLQANVISHLFVRCTDRAQRIHSAMCARGWQ